MRLLLVFFVAMITVGCATPEKFVYQSHSIKTVGLIVFVDEEYTHSHIGTMVFGNSVNLYAPEQLNMRDYIAQRVDGDLRNKGYEIKRISASQVENYQDDSFVTMGWSGYAVRGKYQAILKDIFERNELDILLVFENFSRVDYIGNSSVHIGGHGLYSRNFLGSEMGHIYANIWGFGIYRDPIEFIKSGGNRQTIEVDFFEVNNESIQDIEKGVQQLVDVTIQNTLRKLAL